ncbi:MAG: glycosyltransferase family 2 protein [Patescibacteria group bacterium]|nr:glycosyltransferase family 2 protein [Patescibacteria group bacterium]
MVKKKIKKVCTIILEYQNPKMTLETLDSLKQSLVPSGYTNHITVIDNSPVPDGTLKTALKKRRSIQLITVNQNTGFAAGNNLGIKRGLKKKFDLFLLINNDVEVDRYFLKHLLKSAKDGADLVVPKIYFAKGYEYHKDRYKKSELGKVIWYAGGYFDWDNVLAVHTGVNQVDKGQHDQSRSIDFANACCLLVKKQVFETIGLLDPKYFLYFEDADFSYRAFKNGFKILYQPKSFIYHKSSASSGSGSKLHDYYITRNRLIFGMNYASLRTKFALLRQALKQIINGREGEKQAVKDFFLNRLGKGRLI